MSDDLVKRLRDGCSCICQCEKEECKAYSECRDADDAADRIEELEVKLAKAVEVATNAINNIDALNTLAPVENEQRWRASDLIDQEVISARTTLAKLTGGKDDNS